MYRVYLIMQISSCIPSFSFHPLLPSLRA